MWESFLLLLPFMVVMVISKGRHSFINMCVLQQKVLATACDSQKRDLENAKSCTTQPLGSNLAQGVC